MPISSSVSTVSRRRVAGAVERRQVEVAALVERRRAFGVLEVEVLDFGPDVEGEAKRRGALQVALEYLSRVAGKWRAVRQMDVAEHSGDPAFSRAPGQDLQCRRVGEGGHVALAGAGEAFNRTAIEADALLERFFQLLEGDREALERAENVGEPEANELDILLTALLQDELAHFYCF